jgi:hypothetical protein
LKIMKIFCDVCGYGSKIKGNVRKHIHNQHTIGPIHTGPQRSKMKDIVF